MNFKEELAQRTAEAEEVLKRYLPKEKMEREPRLLHY